jgi:phosphoglycolate phosphatase
MEHFALSSYFKNIYGSRLNGELSDKAELINHIIEKENLNHHQTIMIGDRKHDILGAKKCEISSIGVTYGYGSEAELSESGADYLANSPLEILKLLRKMKGPDPHFNKPRGTT